jgi:hypothetical protein
MIIRDKVVLYAQPGALPEQALEQLITKARNIDMDEVRASLATSAERAGRSRLGYDAAASSVPRRTLGACPSSRSTKRIHTTHR